MPTSRSHSGSRSGSRNTDRPDTHRRDPSESREQRKANTRQALIDAALEILEDEGFTSLSLREVAKRAGIVPTAFYRHFHDLDELGLVLVEESIGSLHDLLNAARRGVIDPDHVVRPSLAILAEHVSAHRGHFRFLVRERFGGSATLRKTIGREITLFATELAVDLARDPRRRAWPTDDIQMLADLLVTVIVATIEVLSDTADTAEAQAPVLDSAAKQMTVVVLGAAAWKPRS